MPQSPEERGPATSAPDDGTASAWSGNVGDDFLDVVRVTVDGILVVDADGRVRFANPAAADVLGRDLTELRELPFGLPLTGGRGFAQLDVARPDGSTAVLEMHVAPLRWRGQDVRVVTLRDITARVLAERRLADSEERFSLSASGANDGLWDWDRESDAVYTSARLQQLLGQRPRDRQEDPWRLLERVHPEDVESLHQEIDRHVTGQAERFRHEFRLRRRDGSWLWVMARGLVVSDRGRVLRFAGSLTDISDRKGAEENLRRLALHDPLTGLSNRTLLLDHLNGAIERYRRAGTAYAVLFFDLDLFKPINDSLGHAVGDALLVEVSRRIEQCVRGTDTVARLGGDEFAVLLDAPEDLDTVLSTVERIQRAIAVPLRIGSHVAYITASIGIARGEDLAPDPETALRYADIAMYEAKRAGRNGYKVFAAAMHAESSARLQLHSDLRDAEGHELLFPRYQPIVELGSRRVVGFEALLRWQVAPGSVLDAAAFIDAAEETDVIVPAGWRLLRTACRQLRDWRAAGFPVEMTVNVAERQLVDARLPDKVAALLHELDLEGHALSLEISERTAIMHVEGALTTMDRLRALGVGILIDDFGTGYSSLSAIHQMPLTGVKIDKVFVDGLGHHGTGDIIAAIVALATRLHLQVVAEGIETAAQRDLLRGMGCERGQGYLFGRAMDADAATRLLRAHAREGPGQRRLGRAVKRP